MGLFSGILGAVGTAIAPGIGTAIGGAIGGAIDGDRARSTANQAADQMNAFNADQSAQTRQFNQEQAALNRTFQWDSQQEAERYGTEMSSTAYQRATKDMMAAGINPMLAVSQGGASSPSVGTLSGSAASQGSFATSADRMAAVSTALQATKLSQDIQESNSRIGVNQADIALKSAQTNRETASAGNLEQQTVKIQVELPKLQAEAQLVQSQAQTELVKQAALKAQQALAETQRELEMHKIDATDAAARLDNAKTVLVNLAQPEARNAANAQDSWWMKNISPYLPDFAKSIGAGAAAKAISK